MSFGSKHAPFSVCHLLIQHFYGLSNSSVFCNEKVHWTKIFSSLYLSLKKCRWGCKLTQLIIQCDYYTLHLVLPRVCCYVFTFASLVPSVPVLMVPPCSLNIFPQPPCSGHLCLLCSLCMKHYCVRWILFIFPASCWFQLKFLLTDQCTLKEPPAHGTLPLPFLHSFLVVWPS